MLFHARTAHAYTHAPHINTEDITDNIGTIGPNAEVSYEFKVVGLKIGKFQLAVGLESDKVELVIGETEVPDD